MAFLRGENIMSKVDIIPIKNYLDNKVEDFSEIYILCGGKKSKIVEYLIKSKKRIKRKHLCN